MVPLAPGLLTRVGMFQSLGWCGGNDDSKKKKDWSQKPVSEAFSELLGLSFQPEPRYS
jgi:hypothetical protein